MSNPREFLNNSVISPSLLPDILGKKTLWNMENTKWAETKGGTYSSASVVAVVSLSYTPLFTGSTIYYAAWINGACTMVYNYYPTAHKTMASLKAMAMVLLALLDFTKVIPIRQTNLPCSAAPLLQSALLI